MTKMNRERAIFYLEDYAATYRHRLSAEVQEIYNMAIEALRQERPKGRWIEVPDKIWSHEFKCSCCGRSVYTMIGEKGVVNWYPYCHCGADMRGEEE